MVCDLTETRCTVVLIILDDKEIAKTRHTRNAEKSFIHGSSIDSCASSLDLSSVQLKYTNLTQIHSRFKLTYSIAAYPHHEQEE